MHDYVRKILAARVYDVAVESPLDPMPRLSQRLGNQVLLKREDLQPIFSFKLRGAYNKIAGLPQEVLERGVICASAGNHAQGVALAAQKLGTKAVIVMPCTTPGIKVQAVRSRGGRVVLHGDTFDEAYAHARELEAEKALTFIHPYDDPEVIAGQGTIGMEILRQRPDPIEAVFVPIGGGGLAAGIAAYVKFLRPEVGVIGVEPDDAASMGAAIAAGERVVLDQVGLFADGVAVRQAGVETFRLCRELLDAVVTVDTDEICAAVKDIFEDTRAIAEPAGAISLAGLKKHAEQRQDPGTLPDRDQQRCQPELRPASPRGRAGRDRRAARGAAGGNHPRGSRAATAGSSSPSAAARSPSSTTVTPTGKRRTSSSVSSSPGARRRSARSSSFCAGTAIPCST